MEDGGYTEKWRECWTEAGWQDRGDDETPSLWGDSRFNQSNQPVVGVTWYAAVAYCRWLSQKMGKNYRLPTEAEWERAVRHTDGREYPWGQQEPRAMMTNFQPTGLERPTAVGIFPQDTAVCGAQDMAGNINEWCQTRWRNESGREYTLPYKPDDGRENLEGANDVWRVIRGGSYYDDEGWLRCAYRGRYHSNFRNYYGGFRVVVVPIFRPPLVSEASGL